MTACPGRVLDGTRSAVGMALDLRCPAGTPTVLHQRKQRQHVGLLGFVSSALIFGISGSRESTVPSGSARKLGLESQQTLVGLSLISIANRLINNHVPSYVGGRS